MQDNQETVKKIIAAVRTTEERDIVYGALKICEESLYELKHESVAITLKKIMPQRLLDLFSGTVSSEEMKNDSELLKKFITDVKSGLAVLSELKIEFAIRPREEIIEKAFFWVLREVGAGIILNADYDKTMLGGVRLTFEGRYKELTLSGIISRVLNRERVNFLNTISGKKTT